MSVHIVNVIDGKTLVLTCWTITICRVSGAWLKKLYCIVLSLYLAVCFMMIFTLYWFWFIQFLIQYMSSI